MYIGKGTRTKFRINNNAYGKFSDIREWKAPETTEKLIQKISIIICRVCVWCSVRKDDGEVQLTSCRTIGKLFLFFSFSYSSFSPRRTIAINCTIVKLFILPFRTFSVIISTLICIKLCIQKNNTYIHTHYTYIFAHMLTYKQYLITEKNFIYAHIL